LKEAAYAIRKRGFSDYPVFPISRVEQVTGQLLIHRRDLKLEWNFYASYLDEFVQRGLVEDQEAFKAAYKDPRRILLPVRDRLRFHQFRISALPGGLTACAIKLTYGGCPFPFRMRLAPSSCHQTEPD
jgi:hypothetical protein